MIAICEAELPNAVYGNCQAFAMEAAKAVRLPREYRFEGSQVRARRVAKGVLSWNRSLRTPPSGLRNWTG